MKIKALVSGSFDPVTLGHVDIITRASAMFDEVYVAICNNTEKSYTFSLDQRKQMMEEALSDLSNVRVDICEGLLADYTKQHGITVIVRGIRDASDAPYEMMLSTINRGLGNCPDTIFIPAKPEYFHLSSSFVRDMIKYSQPLDNIVPKSVIDLLEK